MALFGRETAEDRQRVEAWQQWVRRQHPLALASAVLSVFSLTHFGTLFVDELAGIILGVIAIRAVRGSTSSDRAGSAKMGYVGVVVGAISLAVAIVLYTRRAG